jgi:hypothetical protein
VDAIRFPASPSPRPNTTYSSDGKALFTKDKTELIRFINNGTSYEIPSSVTKINEYGFADAKALSTLLIPAGVSDIGEAALAGCTGMSLVTIDSANTHYSTDGKAIFKTNSSNLVTYASSGESYTIPANVVGLSESAFRDSATLKSLILPSQSALMNFGAGNGVGMFSGCTALTSVSVAGDAFALSSDGKSFLSKDGTQLILFPVSDPSYTIPAGVTEVGTDAFAACQTLESVGFSSSVKTIGIAAFGNCGALRSIEIPDSITEVGHNAFGYCTELKSATLPQNDTYTTIEKSTFDNCRALTTVSFGANITAIKEDAFSSADITTINFGGTKAQWDAISMDATAFDITPSSTTLNCSDGTFTLHF